MISKKFLNYIVLIVILVCVESSCTRNKTSKSNWSPQSLHLEIKSKGLKTLQSKREKALNDGLLITEKDSWVKGAISASKKSEEKKIKLNIFLTDLDDFAMVNKIMASYFDQPYPARAAIGVVALPRGALVEMDAVMVL